MYMLYSMNLYVVSLSRKDETRLDSLLLFKTVVQKSLDLETESLGFVAVLFQLIHSGTAKTHSPCFLTHSIG